MEAVWQFKVSSGAEAGSPSAFRSRVRAVDVPRILIIEDERNMVTGLQFNLEARGYKVSAAYDGEDGYHKALEQHPDLIILDLMLPKCDGYEVCRRLKKEVPDIPIVMLTARSQESEVVLGLELGA